MIEQLKRGKGSQDGTSSFQSLMMSLAGRVGMGNIGGVATAIAFGGPGAVFWMWTSAFLGGATSFIESTLGQIYKEKDPDTGEYRGGPAYYFEKAYKHKARGLSLTHGILFAVVTILAMSFFLPGVQANGMASAVDTAWGILTWITAIGLVILLAFIVIGGVKRIAHFAVIVVPAMALLYILIAVVVFFVNFTEIPRVFELIFSSAFGVQPVFGAILGLAVKWGVQRGIYSNEAGQGTGPHAAAAAEVSHPAKEGFAQSFAVYVDTQFVCSATAFIIISTGTPSPATLGYLVRTARRCRDAGRIAQDVDPDVLATEVWTVCHGILSLVVSRVASRRTLASGIPLLTAVIVAAGDDPAACRRSVEASGPHCARPGTARPRRRRRRAATRVWSWAEQTRQASSSTSTERPLSPP